MLTPLSGHEVALCLPSRIQSTQPQRQQLTRLGVPAAGLSEACGLIATRLCGMSTNHVPEMQEAIYSEIEAIIKVQTSSLPADTVQTYFMRPERSVNPKHESKSWHCLLDPLSSREGLCL